jgi:dipeptidyl aminopeptidase/acylaminoacyl peptidase
MRLFTSPCYAVVVLLTFFFAISSSVAQDTIASDPQPYTAFSALPKYRGPALSPDGNRLLFVQNITTPEEVAILKSYDLKTGKNHYLLKSDNEKVKINWYRWVNDDRFVVSVRVESKRGKTKVHDTRLISLRFDEENPELESLISQHRLKHYATNKNYTPQFQDEVIDWLPDEPDHILMAIDVVMPGLPSVYKVNVVTGKVKRLIKGKREIRDWMTDRQHNVRIGVTLNYESGEREVLLKEGDEYKTLFSYNAMNEKGEYPLGFAKDPNILYYRGYKGDFKAIFSLNLSTMEHSEIYAAEGYDVDGGLIYSSLTNDVVGIRHNGRQYWDKSLAGLQKGLDKALPEFTNTLVSFSEDEKTYILYIENDVTPGTYLIGSRERGSLDVLFQQYEQIDQSRLSKHKLVTYKARDGVEIEAFVTLPKGEGPFPTIIHPHGGPGARDFSGFDYWTAYFTNKGYAVLRPNFRGSRGYGFSFAQSQMKGWGLAMQDDITDGAMWMVEQGYAQENNLCIVGASYGGYAALMATVKTPELFKCAVSFAGVSSLKHLVQSSRGFLNNEFVKNQIGDDSDDLEARSPYYNAKGITTPILLVHGEEDRTVLVRQSRYMADELDDLNKEYTYVELEAGDHGLSIQRNRHRFFAELDAFLDKHLSAPSSKDNVSAVTSE